MKNRHGTKFALRTDIRDYFDLHFALGKTVLKIRKGQAHDEFGD